MNESSFNPSSEVDFYIYFNMFNIRTESIYKH